MCHVQYNRRLLLHDTKDKKIKILFDNRVNISPIFSGNSEANAFPENIEVMTEW